MLEKRLVLFEISCLCVYSTGSSSLDRDPPLAEKITKPPFLNLPLWANFYNHTELSHTTRPLEQPTLLDDLNLSLNPQPGWPSSTG